MRSFQTQNLELLQNADYARIKDILYQLISAGFVKAYNNHCLDASKIVMGILAQHNIKSDIAECCALLTVNTDTKINHLYAIGFYEDLKRDRIDTHYVVITDTIPKILIDASIFELLLNDQKIILEEYMDGAIMGNYSYDNFKLTYLQK